MWRRCCAILNLLRAIRLMKKLYMCGYFVLLGIVSRAQITNNTINSEIDKNVNFYKITGDEIRDNIGLTLSQLLNQQLGLIVNGSYQPKGSLINIYLEGALGGKVLILLNHVPIYDPSEIASSFDLNFISLNNIESIDIYKGSLSSIYGSGAVAGVININTKKINKDSINHNKIYCAVGNQKTLNTNLQLWKSVNKFSYYLNYNNLKSSGFSYANDTTASKGFDNDGYNSKEISGSIDYHLSNSIFLSSKLRYSKYKSDSDIENFIDTKNYYYKKNNLLGDIQLKYFKKNITFSVDYNFNKTNRGYYYSPFENEHYKGIVHFGDIHLQVCNKRSPSIALGFDCRNNSFIYSAFDTATGNSTIIYPSSLEFGAYSNIFYSSIDSIFSISMGGRLSKMVTTDLLGVFHFFSSIKIAKTIRASFSIGTGYKYPSIFQLNVENFGNAALLPERSIYYKLSLDRNRKASSFCVTGFYRKENSIINFENNTSAYSNFEKLNCWGLEWQGKIILLSKINFAANYTFLAGREFTESRKTFFDTVSYNYLIRRPKHVVNAGIVYNVFRNLSLGINGKFVSNFYDYGLASDDYKMKSYLIFNTQLSYQIKRHWILYLNSQNITNKQFFDVRGYNSIPFLFNMGVEVVF
jgi:vitamin B12 transporter